MRDDDLERRVSELEEKIGDRRTSQSLIRRIDDLEDKVEGRSRKSVESRLKELEKKIEEIERQ